MSKIKNAWAKTKEWTKDNKEWIIVGSVTAAVGVTGLYLNKKTKVPPQVMDVVNKVDGGERFLYQLDDSKFAWMAIVADTDIDGNPVDLADFVKYVQEGKFREE